jgi:hypothetical protein
MSIYKSISTVINGVIVNNSFNSSGVKKGSGKTSIEKRLISDFNTIKVNGSMNIIYEKSDAPNLSIEADDNILDIITTVVKNGTLYICSKDSFSTQNKITIKCSSTLIKSVILSGSGYVTLNNIQEPELNLNVKGSGDIKVNGVCTKLTASVEGSGDIDSEELISQNLLVNVSGSGNAIATAKHSVIASVAGSGNIKVKGKPKTQQVSESGSGRVKIK